MNYSYIILSRDLLQSLHTNRSLFTMLRIKRDKASWASNQWTWFTLHDWKRKIMCSKFVKESYELGNLNQISMTVSSQR